MKQHTTLEANLSKCVTKVHWVVEVVNGRLKKLKFLDRVVPNSHIPYILGDFVRIVASLLNKYKPPIKINDDGDNNLARTMRLACSSVENPVEKSVLENPSLRFQLLMLVSSG